MARAEEMQRDRAYRIYVTDALRIGLLNNSSARYADLFKPEETRTSEEIVDSIRNKLGGANDAV